MERVLETLEHDVEITRHDISEATKQGGLRV